MNSIEGQLTSYSYDNLTNIRRELQKENADLRAKLDVAEVALEKINNIRNSIVGTQTINWSEHIYPLVAALNEAGLKGMGYPKARKYLGTLIERTVTAEKECDKLQARNVLLVEALKELLPYAEDWCGDGSAIVNAEKALEQYRTWEAE